MSLSKILQNPKTLQFFLEKTNSERDEKIKNLSLRYAEQILAITEIALYEGISEQKVRENIEKNFLKNLSEIRTEATEKILSFQNFSQNIISK